MSSHGFRKGDEVLITDFLTERPGKILRFYGAKAALVSYWGTSSSQDFTTGKITSHDVVKQHSFPISKLIHKPR